MLSYTKSGYKDAELTLKELDIRISLANARGNIDSTEVAWTYFNLAELIYTNLNEKPTSNIMGINHYLDASVF